MMMRKGKGNGNGVDRVYVNKGSYPVRSYRLKKLDLTRNALIYLESNGRTWNKKGRERKVSELTKLEKIVLDYFSNYAHHSLSCHILNLSYHV
eukprot:scaffold87106_cov73-Attheya_sp.AAC.3